MALYGQMIVTQLGKILYAKAQTGKALTYTRIRIGSGNFSGDPTNLTDLVQPIGYVPINSLSVTNQTAHIKGVFQNSEITQITYSCEIGLYAQDPDYGEILYAYANAGSNGDYIPPIAAGPFSREFQLNVAVGNASQVIVNIPSNAFVTQSDFIAHVNDTNLHMTRSEIQSGFSTLQNQIDLIKATFPDSFTHNLFTEDLTTLDAITLTHGYYNASQTRLEV
ncbi:hypothetical protein ACQCN2_01145 [Brevibacillus ginsengisoli]|uniref:hypothetical protein n=1 Tax=Brevibacillus ginsengisoli TaxID=363854 RepID=UPI003CF8EE60